jgi:Fur family transcriptional regulator, ferric uptake regulator
VAAGEAIEWRVKSAAENGGGGFGAKELLRGVGMRVTTVRVAILEALGGAKAPVTAQELADQLAEADRVTIYRTLNSLVEAGLAHKVDPGDRVFRFGLTGGAKKQDTAGHGHPHFVCDECGNVECLEDTEVIVQKKKGAAPVKKKMRLSAKDVLLHGTCEECGEDEGKRGR